MAEYLGELGALVKLMCASEETTERPDRYALQHDTTGGVRAKVRARTPRSWSIGSGVLADRDLAAIEGFMLGEWGHGPWLWVSVAAQHGNMLTPDESLCLTVQSSAAVLSGPMVCADETWAGRSVDVTYRGTNWDVLWDTIPVLEGRAVTFSADVSGDGQVAPRVAVGFYDTAGQVVSGPHVSAGGAVQGVSRVSMTVTAPPGAVEVRVGALASVRRLTRPQVTWTAYPLPWTTGKGCRKAVPVSANSAVRIATGDRATLNSASVLIQELS